MYNKTGKVFNGTRILLVSEFTISWKINEKYI